MFTETQSSLSIRFVVRDTTYLGKSLFVCCRFQDDWTKFDAIRNQKKKILNHVWRREFGDLKREQTRTKTNKRFLSSVENKRAFNQHSTYARSYWFLRGPSAQKNTYTQIKTITIVHTILLVSICRRRKIKNKKIIKNHPSLSDTVSDAHTIIPWRRRRTRSRYTRYYNKLNATRRRRLFVAWFIRLL